MPSPAEQVREAEIAQAIDRVRPVFNRRRIIVLTNVALDLAVDHARTWPELHPGKFAYAFAQYGVLPLSAGDLCRAFNSLWPTAKGAENALAYLRNTLKTPNNESIWSFQGIFEDLLRATYRRKGSTAARRERSSAPFYLIHGRSFRACSASSRSSTLSARPTRLPRPEHLSGRGRRNGSYRRCLPPCPRRRTSSLRCRQMGARPTCSAWPA